MYHLSDSDSRAVDCIMHFRSSNSNSGERNANSSSSFDLSESRLRAASAILDVISQCPAQDPSPSLVRRTVRRVHMAEPLVTPAVIGHGKSLST
jgi:hypothetical protein